MWNLLEKITTQVHNYSSSVGQAWYILVFGYRLVVITSLGGSVYGDEQGAFQCSVTIAGCANMCYNAFAKISHLRFWAFQLIAISTPTIFFHFYSLHIQSQIEKIRETEKVIKSLETGEAVNESSQCETKFEKEVRKLPRKRKTVGKYKMKEVYNGTEKKVVPHTRKIKILFIISLLIRLSFEILFTYFGYKLFNIENGEVSQSSFMNFLWMRVPALYRCKDNGDHELRLACRQHLFDDQGFVPCWVSRPYEKTVFLRYMNILSFICMLITAAEVLQFIFRQINHQKSVQRRTNYDIEQHRLTIEPPSFDAVMKRSAPYGNAANIYKGPGNPEAPVSTSLFECVSFEELDKQRSAAKNNAKPRVRSKEKQAAADAPPYESDHSFSTNYSKKIRR